MQGQNYDMKPVQNNHSKNYNITDEIKYSTHMFWPVGCSSSPVSVSSSILTVHFTKLFSLFNIYCLTEDENNLFLHLLSSSYQKGLDPPVLQVIVKHRTACKNEKSLNKKVHAMIHTSGFLTKFSVTLPFHLETRLVPGTGTKSKDQNQNVSLYQYKD